LGKKKEERGSWKLIKNQRLTVIVIAPSLLQVFVFTSLTIHLDRLKELVKFFNHFQIIHKL